MMFGVVSARPFEKMQVLSSPLGHQYQTALMDERIWTRHHWKCLFVAGVVVIQK
jgi:hypothetical protein